MNKFLQSHQAQYFFLLPLKHEHRLKFHTKGFFQSGLCNFPPHASHHHYHHLQLWLFVGLCDLLPVLTSFVLQRLEHINITLILLKIISETFILFYKGYTGICKPGIGNRDFLSMWNTEYDCRVC